MKARKPIIIFLILISIFVLGGCASQDKGPRKLWDKYVAGINKKSIEEVAATYYAPESNGYKEYIGNTNNLAQFDAVDSIKTNTFQLLTQSDLSSSTVVQKYYSAKVSATVVLQNTNFDLEFEVYMSKTSTNGWFFTSQVVVDPLADRFGNLPDDLWLRNALHTDGDFLYKPDYTLTATDVTYTSAAISSYTGNAKDVVIPSEVGGLPVTTIKKYAFMKLGSIFEITFSGSKMRSVTIPDTVRTIEEYAFFESAKLKELRLPSSVTSVGEYAFASCKKLSKVIFDFDDSNLYTEDILKEIESSSTSGMVIKNAHNMYVGDIIQLSEGNNELVNWSVDKTNVASIDSDKGILTAKSPGDIVVTAALKSDPTVKATVKINVQSCKELTKIQGSAFERCSGLKEMYIYARNPYSFGIAGTSFKLPKGVTIYVPKGSKEMYINSSNWSSYKDQIKEME